MDNKIKTLIKDNYGIIVNSSEEFTGYYDSNFRISNDEKSYFVKLFGLDKESTVKFQIDFINNCYNANIPVAKILKTKTGAQHILVNGKPLILQEFLKGKPFMNSVYTDTLLEDIGGVLGKIHKVSSQHKFKGTKWKEYNWDLAQFHFIISNLEKAKPYLKEECLSLVSAVINDWKIKESKLKGLKKGVIHNDFHEMNLLVENNHCTGVIDFGDSLESWFVADIAIALTHICFCNKQPFKKARIFFKGYQKYFSLPRNELALLSLFSRMRAAMLIVNQKMDFKNNIPQDYQNRFDDAVKVLKLLSEEDNKNILKNIF